MIRAFLLFILTTYVSVLCAEEYHYQFRLTLKDKDTTEYSIDRPESYLSQRAIERRMKQGLKIDQTDFPIASIYIKQIEELDCVITSKSKWLNTVTVYCVDSLIVNQFDSLPFVQDITFVWRGIPRANNSVTDTLSTYLIQQDPISDAYYGRGELNAQVSGVEYLHSKGYKGKGLQIAVIDAGFSNFPKIELLDSIDILGSKGFVYGREDIFNTPSEHGLNVLSCMAGNKPNIYVGTAPEASYWLLGSEDSRSEYPIEQDYWATAIEYADSVGVDIVNTSLGYSKFDYPAKGYTVEDLDGKTAFITKAANYAMGKGMLVVCSAGNSGNSKWQKITPPSDSGSVLTVGAMYKDSTMTKFSSQGFTTDMRVKPDVVTLGSLVTVVDSKGLLVNKSGTSFSSPIIAGISACLWQAYPSLTSRELLNIIRHSSDRYDIPDPRYGYGIPDWEKAILLASKLVENKKKYNQ